MKLPESREEYTVFALEKRNDVPLLMDIRQIPNGYYSVHEWISYTVDNFPDLVSFICSSHKSRDNAPLWVSVTIAGINVGEIYNWEHSFSECLQLLVERKEVILGENNGKATKNRT